ncbi:MAG: ABC-F family ATP-binding cassette domain-containing protein [Anaerolineaceae bacterium]|nr:ABC-F family ATP-binding cassette domain-containing protein [Anaerolineaceae bacterium]
MIQIRNCSKVFGAENIFHQLNLNINDNEKIGLIGPNGCGKTTLMQCIAGILKPDQGFVHITVPNLQIAYLPQQVNPPEQETIASYLGLPIRQLAAAYQELELLSADILNQTEAYQTLLENIQSTESMLEMVQPVQTALGMKEIPLFQPFAHLSSGQKTRFGLLKIALDKAPLILLDEPTNHLDQNGRSWLIQWILQSDSAFLLISHDRDFIDQVANRIWYMDKTKQELTQYEGNYSNFKAFQRNQQEKQVKTQQQQLDEIVQLKHAARVARSQAVKKKGGKGDSGDKFAKGYFSDRTTTMIKKAKNLEKRMHELQDNLETLDNKDWLLSIKFQEAERSSERVIETQHIVFGYGVQEVVRSSGLQMRYGDRIVLTGENGSGKTTIMQTLMGNILPIEGSIITGHEIKRGYLTQEQSDMPDDLNAVTYIQSILPKDETSVRNFLARYLFTADKVFQPIISLSNGEKKRLSLAGLVYSGCNVLFLDEPLNHLDIPSREQIQSALQQFYGTILVVEHDPYFINSFPNQEWSIVDGQVYIEPM